MRKLMIALAALLMTGSLAFAQSGAGSCGWHSPSSSVDGWNQSSLDVCVDGEVVSDVEFSVANAMISLDRFALAPRTNFTIRIPVTNNSDRAINVSDDSEFPSWLQNFVTPPSTLPVPAGSTRNFDYTVDIPTTGGSDAPLNLPGATFGQGDVVNFTLSLVGTGVVPDVAGVQD